MSIVDTIQPDIDQPVIYLIGNRMIEDQLRAFATQLDQKLEGKVIIAYLDADGPEGATIVERYEIESEQIPAIMILEDDESVYQSWFGQNLPEVDQVAFEVGEITGNSEA